MSKNLCTKTEKPFEDEIYYTCPADTVVLQQECDFFVKHDINNGYCFYNPSASDECQCPAAKYFASNPQAEY